MLQRTFLMLSRASWAQRIITRLPPARRTAHRFVAGETIAEAIRAIRALNARGLNATLDFLGESVTNEDEATRAADEYLRALDAIAASGVRANVSLKLTQLGLDLDDDFCLRNVGRVVAHAQLCGNFVRVDMEGTPYTDRTLRLVRALHRDFDNIGAVIQAYLYRSEADLLALTDEAIRIRLCKGAYQEPPDKAYPHKRDVDANFVKLAGLLLDRSARARRSEDGRVPPLAALATHDEKMIAAAKAHITTRHIGFDRFEFQMLYGVRRELQERLVQEGFAVRIYVPYGTHWYPYFMRRLAERPANVWFFLRSLFTR